MEKTIQMAEAKNSKNATQKKEVAKSTTQKAEVKKAIEKADSILLPSADDRLKKLETFNRIGEKKRKIDTKLEELVNFNASNDGTQSKMEFTADSGYRFTISNPVTIKVLLKEVENQLSTLKKETDTEIIDFSI